MPSDRIRLCFSTRLPRDEAIHSIESQCQEYKIDILDCRMFSNMSLVLEVEGAVSHFLSLEQGMGRNEFRIDILTQTQFADLALKAPDELVSGTIQVTFSTGDGSLVIPVPSVPG
jgi:hypothetical protein